MHGGAGSGEVSRGTRALSDGAGVVVNIAENLEHVEQAIVDACRRAGDVEKMLS